MGNITNVSFLKKKEKEKLSRKNKVEMNKRERENSRVFSLWSLLLSGCSVLLFFTNVDSFFFFYFFVCRIFFFDRKNKKNVINNKSHIHVRITKMAKTEKNDGKLLCQALTQCCHFVQNEMMRHFNKYAIATTVATAVIAAATAAVIHLMRFSAFSARQIFPQLLFHNYVVRFHLSLFGGLLFTGI